MLIDTVTLTVIQRERYDEFVREAALRRLLRTEKNSSATAVAATNDAPTANLVTRLKQLLVTGLQTSLRAAHFR
ncbi:MAG: hypothetical protein R2932_45665 [Caldilineaceae bacterium]